MSRAKLSARTRHTREYRMRKLAAKLCIEGGCYEPIDRALRCARHADAQNARKRASYARRKADRA